MDLLKAFLRAQLRKLTWSRWFVAPAREGERLNSPCFTTSGAAVSKSHGLCAVMTRGERMGDGVSQP